MHTYSGSEPDRTAIRRLDDDWLRSCWDAEDTRFVCFAAERPMVNVAGANGPEICCTENPDPGTRMEGAIPDARWFPREEVTPMLTGDHPEGIYTPPPFAIAHHLITEFVEGG